MELGVAVRAHVGDVDVADPAAGALVGARAVGLHPVAVAAGLLVRQRLHRHRPRGAVSAPDGQLDLLARLVDQEPGRPGHRPRRLAVDRHHRVARPHVEPRAVERGGGVRVPGVAGDDARDRVDAAGVGPVDAELALPVVGPGAVLAAALVGVRGAELAQQLPQQVGELAAGAHPVDQGQVALVDAVPVDAGHVLHPEVLPLEPPRLAEHLPPLGRRAHRHLHPVEVDPPPGPAGGVVLGGRLTRPDHPQPLPGAVEQRRGVPAQVEVGDVGDQGLGLPLDEVVGEQGAGGGLGELVAAAALDRE